MTTPATCIPQDIVDTLRLGPAETRRTCKHIGYWRALQFVVDPIPPHVNVLGTAPLQWDGGYTGDQAEAFTRLPWPGDHLDASMPVERREAIADALGSFPIVARYCGNARSRLQPMGLCGGAERGNGTWVWPVGLIHYVIDHGLVLDDLFLASLGMRPH